MPYNYPVAAGYKSPPRLTIPTPTAPAGGSCWAYVESVHVALAPSGETATRTTFERGQVRQIPILRLLPATPTDNEAQHPAPVKYSPEFLHPGRPIRRVVAQVPRNAVSQVDQTSAYNSPPPVPRPLRSGSTKQAIASRPSSRPTSASSSSSSRQATRPVTPERLTTVVAAHPDSLFPKEHASYQAIGAIERELHNCSASFQPPSDLDFESLPSTPAAFPRLASTPKNAPLLQQIQKIERLQSKLRSVTSHGDRGVRKERKRVAAQLERALECLRRLEVQIWNNSGSKVRSRRT
ncbi:hypothetical protein BDV93DRAFT_606724 [Ceratobasidium sp. AG-I]|nr:hypothetical protein BDV93DRAFT_606724 [Ceratobasidium sp. AG-I]